jgi:hypothetical protein
VIDGALGEGSAFHELYGFYVHGVSIESAVLPHGWEDRTIAVCNANTRWKTGHCLEAHDLAASKLAAFRDKDRDFVRVLLSEELVDSSILSARLNTLELEKGEIARRRRWVDRTVSDLRSR